MQWQINGDNMIKQLKENKTVQKTKWYIKNLGLLRETLEMFQEFYNTSGKAFRKPESELEKALVENMRRLGMEIN